jgi:hypothetical protein
VNVVVMRPPVTALTDDNAGPEGGTTTRSQTQLLAGRCLVVPSVRRGPWCGGTAQLLRAGSRTRTRHEECSLNVIPTIVGSFTKQRGILMAVMVTFTLKGDVRPSGVCTTTCLVWRSRPGCSFTPPTRGVAKSRSGTFGPAPRRGRALPRVRWERGWRRAGLRRLTTSRSQPYSTPMLDGDPGLTVVRHISSHCRRRNWMRSHRQL